MTNRARAQCACDIPRAEKIARLNDTLRIHAEGGLILATQGVRSLPEYDPIKLLKALADYTAFDSDNDPHGERDFGDLEIGNTSLFWKVDYYDMDMIYGSPDPANASVTRRVLTVMLTNEW